MGTFDPATHLHKQGWKGKGTATAASIFSPTSSAPASDASTPLPTHTAHTTTRSWQTTTFNKDKTQKPSFGSGSGSNTMALPPVREKTAGVPSTAARVGKEMARRGLYSRFFRGKTVVPEPEEEDDLPVEEIKAGPSNSNSEPVSESSDTAKLHSNNSSKKGKEREGETKEEKRARRAEKAKRKEEKAARKAAKTVASEPVVMLEAGLIEETGPQNRKKKRKADHEEPAIDPGEDSARTRDKAERKKAKREERRRQASTTSDPTLTDLPIPIEAEIPKAERKDKKDKKDKEGKKDKKVKKL